MYVLVIIYEIYFENTFLFYYNPLYFHFNV
jgi:hypothetical protein